MWLYVLLLLLGAALLSCGILTAKRTSERKWHILTAAGAIIALIGMLLSVCTLLLVNREDVPEDNNAMSKNGEYTITDELSIRFSALDEGNGYGVYDAADGTLVDTIVFEEGEVPNTTDGRISALEDHNGDGANDIGIQMTDGSAAWFCYDAGLVYNWPESINGCFPRESERHEPEAYISHPFEPVNAREELTDRQKELYDELYQKIKNIEPFSYDAATYGYDTLDDLFSVWRALVDDNLEIATYFMMEEVIGEDSMVTEIKSKYMCKWISEESTDPEEIRAGIAQFDAAAEEIISGLRDSMTTREKYEYLAKAISMRTSYDHYAESSAHYTCWGGIVGGLSICQGYTQAYAYLCQKADLWCKMVSGASEGTAHSWNLIWLPEGTYHVDVTWADGLDENGNDWARYFAVPQDLIEWDHEIWDDTVATGK